ERVLKNTKVIGKWKDENGGDQAIGYAGVRAKCYSVVCENSRKNMIKAKGLKKSLIKKELSHKIFEDCVLEGKEDQPRTAQFLRIDKSNKRQKITTEEGESSTVKKLIKELKDDSVNKDLIFASQLSEDGYTYLYKEIVKAEAEMILQVKRFKKGPIPQIGAYGGNT
ncbi:856_t:CDS:2, partial [Racocetra fulgida]